MAKSSIQDMSLMTFPFLSMRSLRGGIILVYYWSLYQLVKSWVDILGIGNMTTRRSVLTENQRNALILLLLFGLESLEYPLQWTFVCLWMGAQKGSKMCVWMCGSVWGARSITKIWPVPVSKSKRSLWKSHPMRLPLTTLLEQLLENISKSYYCSTARQDKYSTRQYLTLYS